MSDDLHAEWRCILRDKSFDGVTFLEWVQSIPEISFPTWPLPTEDWLCLVIQFVTHAVEACTKQDAIFRRKRFAFLRFLDKKASHKQAFRQVRGPTKPFVNEIREHVDISVIAVPHPDGYVVDVFGDSLALVKLQVGFPALLHHTPCIIHHVDSYMVTVACTEEWNAHNSEVQLVQDTHWLAPEDVARQLTSFWRPIWNRDDVDPALPCDSFVPPDWVAQVPVFPSIPVNLDDLDLWKFHIRQLKPTARGVDFVSAGDMQLLPDDLLRPLVSSLMGYRQGFPPWFMTGITCALAKTDDIPQAAQSRPITVLPQTYRVWAGVIFRAVTAQWANLMPEGVTGLLPGRGASQAAYSAQVHLELAKRYHSPISGVTLDLKRCFNTIVRLAGCFLLLRFGLPYSLVSQWYKSLCHLTRVWNLNGQILPGAPSSTGFPEGDHWSVLIMLSLACCWVTLVQPCGPPLSIKCSAYADNWSWSLNDPSLHGPVMSCTQNLVQFAGLAIDMNKTWYWTTSPALIDAILASLQPHLGGHSLQHVQSASDLGYQLQYSGRTQLGVARTRYQKGLARLDRLCAMPHDIDVKEAMILASILPATLHGCDIRPLSKADLTHLRSRIADALVGRCRSLSPAILLLCTSNGILDPEFWMLRKIILAARSYLLAATEDIRAGFLHIASRFHGNVTQIKGPASSLGYAVQQFGWTIDSAGLVHATTFQFFDLCTMSIKRLTRFMTFAWQQDLVKMHTCRYSRFSMPDICQISTCSVLDTFAPKDRQYLLRELAGGYQTEAQKSRWDSDISDACPYCGAPDSRTHRLLHCPIGDAVRVHFGPLLTYLADTGSIFPDFPAIPVHPLFDLYQAMHFKAHPGELSDAALHWAQSQVASGAEVHWYTDGSCQHPQSPLTRFAAYSVVLDLATDDQQRIFQARQFLQDGTPPTTLETVLVARVVGEQDILRAELQAIIRVMLDVGVGVVHTDSQSAISLLQKALSASSLSALSTVEHFDLLSQVWSARHRIHVTLRKIKAHDDPAAQSDLLLTYRILGNSHADAAANSACRHLLPDFVGDLEEFHRRHVEQQEWLKQVFQLHLRLRDVKRPSVNPSVQQPTSAEILLEYRQWVVSAPLPALDFDESFFQYSAWGLDLTYKMATWLQQLRWPTDTAGPGNRSPSFSWTEAAVAFMLWAQQYLPVLRPSDDGQELVVLIATDAEAQERGLTMKELTANFLKLLDHTCALTPQVLVPKQKRKRCASIKVLGAATYGAGWERRPEVPCQDQMVSVLQDMFQTGPGQKLLALPSLQLTTGQTQFLSGDYKTRLTTARGHMSAVRLLRAAF
eukprot:Skav208845  [mRNA]  locus=scaffold1839:27694:31653:- [translate_table: standard]